MDEKKRREVCVNVAPLPPPGGIVFLGTETSTLSRPEAETAADRTVVPITNLPKNTHAASPGWVMSHVVLVPTHASHTTSILDTARVNASARATDVAVRQWQAVVALLVARGLPPVV